MNTKKITLILAVLAIAGVIGTITLVTNNDKSGDLYTEFRAEFKNSGVKVLDNETVLSRNVEQKFSDIKSWEYGFETTKGKTTNPKPTLDNLGVNKDDIITKINKEKDYLKGLKARFDKINCDKVLPKDKPDCRKITTNFNGVEERYNGYISKINNFK